MTQTAQVLAAIVKLQPRFPRGLLCCQIAAIVPFTSDKVEVLVCKLVAVGKIKKVANKEDINIMGNECNRYALVTDGEPITTQKTLFQ